MIELVNATMNTSWHHRKLALHLPSARRLSNELLEVTFT